MFGDSAGGCDGRLRSGLARPAPSDALNAKMVAVVVLPSLSVFAEQHDTLPASASPALRLSNLSSERSRQNGAARAFLSSGLAHAPAEGRGGSALPTRRAGANKAFFLNIYIARGKSGAERRIALRLAAKGRGYTPSAACSIHHGLRGGGAWRLWAGRHFL